MIPERTEQASPPPCSPLERCILAALTPPLTINRHFFETPHTQFRLTSIKRHANEGDMHSGLFERQEKAVILLVCIAGSKLRFQYAMVYSEISSYR